eukprot:5881990-Prymnesium_polylepis.1
MATWTHVLSHRDLAMVSTWVRYELFLFFSRERARIPTVKVPPQGGTWPQATRQNKLRSRRPICSGQTRSR